MVAGETTEGYTTAGYLRLLATVAGRLPVAALPSAPQLPLVPGRRVAPERERSGPGGSVR